MNGPRYPPEFNRFGLFSHLPGLQIVPKEGDSFFSRKIFVSVSSQEDKVGISQGNPMEAGIVVSYPFVLSYSLIFLSLSWINTFITIADTHIFWYFRLEFLLKKSKFLHPTKDNYSRFVRCYQSILFFLFSEKSFLHTS